MTKRQQFLQLNLLHCFGIWSATKSFLNCWGSWGTKTEIDVCLRHALLLCCPARQQRHWCRWVAKSQRNDEKSLRSAYSSSSSLSFATPPPPLTPTILKIHKLNQVILMLITHFAGTEAPRPPEAEVVLAVEVLLWWCSTTHLRAAFHQERKPDQQTEGRLAQWGEWCRAGAHKRSVLLSVVMKGS